RLSRDWSSDVCSSDLGNSHSVDAPTLNLTLWGSAKPVLWIACAGVNATPGVTASPADYVNQVVTTSASFGFGNVTTVSARRQHEPGRASLRDGSEMGG